MTKKRPVASPLVFIGIAGASGAGKTTLCRMLKRQSRQYEHVKLDNYFKNPKLFPKKLGYVNWESPSNIKFDALLRDLKALRSGKVVHAKSFPTSATAKPKALVLKPKKYILVEGFILLTDKKLREFLDTTIYLDVPAQALPQRRLVRFGAKQVSEYDAKVAIPQFLKFGVKQKRLADHVIDATQTPTAVLKQVKKIIACLPTHKT